MNEVIPPRLEGPLLIAIESPTVKTAQVIWGGGLGCELAESGGHTNTAPQGTCPSAQKYLYFCSQLGLSITEPSKKTGPLTPPVWGTEAPKGTSVGVQMLVAMQRKPEAAL